MDTIKKYLKSTLITIGLMLVFCFFLNIFNYFEILPLNVYKIILVIFTIFSVFVGGFILGKSSLEKGYLEGLKFGILLVFIFFIISFLAFDKGFDYKSIIYYIILVISSCTSSMIGINKKESSE